MSLRVRFQFTTGAALAYSVERLADGFILDFADGIFRASPATPLASLPEGAGVFTGRYAATLATVSSAQWTDGNYCAGIHNTGAGNLAVGLLGVTMHSQDDQPFYGAGGGTVQLASNGLDLVVVETGVQARQALSAILAACAGNLTGAGTGSIVIKGGNTATTRITSSTDVNGNRSGTALSLPT